MEILAGFEFPIRQLVKPNDMITICINKCNPDMAVSNIAPQAASPPFHPAQHLETSAASPTAKPRNPCRYSPAAIQLHPRQQKRPAKTKLIAESVSEHPLSHGFAADEPASSQNLTASVI
ncbi:hypothetical protein Nepgr_030865 [Nepenthes gracilis]|uniref:Uncharacterized protein n=1 Tax=Nepenthes gracilis TaxID=150966 RepID=A0AAD3Y472_NEPGR|nr:hypothetical protein Nepgr_030865 [Nepenthes gracilis]